jgi:hypothetical protein
MTLVYLQLQLHKFLELVMTCSTNSKKKSGAEAVPNSPLGPTHRGCIRGQGTRGCRPMVSPLVAATPWVSQPLYIVPSMT